MEGVEEERKDGREEGGRGRGREEGCLITEHVYMKGCHRGNQLSQGQGDLVW